MVLVGVHLDGLPDGLRQPPHEVGLPVHHLALLWCLNNPHVSTVILGASRKAQLEDNLSALKSKAKLTPDVIEQIEIIMGNKPKPFERY